MDLNKIKIAKRPGPNERRRYTNYQSRDTPQAETEWGVKTMIDPPEGILPKKYDYINAQNFPEPAEACFFSSPPAYPVSDPFLPMTRWQGTIIANGLQWFAIPTPGGFGTTNGNGNIAVSSRLSIGNLLQRLPNFLLKLGSLHLQWQIKDISLPLEVFFQLFFCLH